MPEQPQGAGGFPLRYAAAFRVHLATPGELTLREAYERGREAVDEGIPVPALAQAHHDALEHALRRGGAVDQARTLRLAGQFLAEALSAMEMVRRGYREVRAAALAERREADMVRRLSAFLADGALAGAEPASLAEALRLVAEQARELVEAEACRVGAAGAGVGIDAVDDGWAAVAASPGVAALERLIPPRGAGRLDAGGLAEEPAFHALALAHAPARAMTGWAGARLAALDGAPLGSVQVLTARPGGLRDLDEAVLAHIAQMTAASVERVAWYARRGGLREA